MNTFYDNFPAAGGHVDICQLKVTAKNCCFNLYMDWAHTSSLCEMRVNVLIVCTCFGIFSLLKIKFILILGKLQSCSSFKTMEVSPYKKTPHLNRMYVRIGIWSCTASGKFLFKDKNHCHCFATCMSELSFTTYYFDFAENYYYSKRA